MRAIFMSLIGSVILLILVLTFAAPNAIVAGLSVKGVSSSQLVKCISAVLGRISRVGAARIWWA